MVPGTFTRPSLEQLKQRGFFDLLHDNCTDMPRVQAALAAVSAKRTPAAGQIASNPAFGTLPEPQQHEVSTYLGLPWPIPQQAAKTPAAASGGPTTGQVVAGVLAGAAVVGAVVFFIAFPEALPVLAIILSTSAGEVATGTAIVDGTAVVAGLVTDVAAVGGEAAVTATVVGETATVATAAAETTAATTAATSSATTSAAAATAGVAAASTTISSDNPEQQSKRRRPCGTAPCERPLPVSWPAELPLPAGQPLLIRTNQADREWQGLERGAAQAKLRQSIVDARNRLVLPRSRVSKTTPSPMRLMMPTTSSPCTWEEKMPTSTCVR